MFKVSVLTTGLCRALIRWLTWNKTDFTEEAITPGIMSPVSPLKVSVLWFFSDKFQLRSQKRNENAIFRYVAYNKGFFFFYLDILLVVFPLKVLKLHQWKMNVCVLKLQGRSSGPGHAFWGDEIIVCGAGLCMCAVLQVPTWSHVPY